MSEFTDLLLQTTDPITAIILVAMLLYMRRMDITLRGDLEQLKADVREDLRRHRERIERVEDQHMTDGGTPNDEENA